MKNITFPVMLRANIKLPEVTTNLKTQTKHNPASVWGH